jgi:hemerythrin-like domain-containing protein
MNDDKVNDAKERALRIIHDEHRSISAVLSGLRELARLAQDPAVQPEFGVLHAMIQYIDAYPERLHHPNEELFLFTPLVRRAPETKALVDALSGEHEEGARLIGELQRALLAFEISGSAGAPAFGAAVEVYASFHWNHMRKEERELLPLAERYFDAEDWRAAERAFAGNENPIGGLEEKDFAGLFTRIANLAPAPVGLGDPWKRVSA